MKLHEFHKAARTAWSKLERNFTTKCHLWHRSSSLEGDRCDQPCSESKQEVVIGYKHQSPRRGDKYTPEDSLVD